MFIYEWKFPDIRFSCKFEDKNSSINCMLDTKKNFLQLYRSLHSELVASCDSHMCKQMLSSLPSSMQTSYIKSLIVMYIDAHFSRKFNLLQV